MCADFSVELVKENRVKLSLLMIMNFKNSKSFLCTHLKANYNKIYGSLFMYLFFNVCSLFFNRSLWLGWVGVGWGGLVWVGVGCSR